VIGMENPFLDLIKERRSIRNYQSKIVEEDTIKKIIQSGRYAPSAENRQPWKFIIVTNKDLIKELSIEVKRQINIILKKRFIKKFSFKELKDDRVIQFLSFLVKSKGDTIFFDAPVIVFIISRDEIFNDESCACCAQNMMLAAHSLGLGSCWIGFAHLLQYNKDYLIKLGVPDEYHISSTIIFGYPEGKTGDASFRKVTSDIIKWIK
jgi:nitroreductase